MAKVVGFGDLLVRLSPPGYQRFLQATNFEINYTGAEANMLVFLAMNGISTEFVTRLPDNLISDCALAQLRRFGVGLSHVAFGGDRIATYYLEKAVPAPLSIVYVRKHTGNRHRFPSDFDWNSIFRCASHLCIFTGITRRWAELPSIRNGLREAKHAHHDRFDLNSARCSGVWGMPPAPCGSYCRLWTCSSAGREDAAKLIGLKRLASLPGRHAGPAA